MTKWDHSLDAMRLAVLLSHPEVVEVLRHIIGLGPTAQPERPRKVPLWFASADRAERAASIKTTRGAGEWSPENALRSAGLITVGDPGYMEAVLTYRRFTALATLAKRLRKKVKRRMEAASPVRDKASPTPRTRRRGSPRA